MAERMANGGLLLGGRNDAGNRLDSLDLARGVLILLVIFVHCYGHNYLNIAGPGTISKVWDVLVSATKPIRMPAFFLISGFLAKSLVRKDWSVLLKKRVMFLMYMYTVWLFINLTVSAYLDYVQGLHPFSILNISTSVVSKLVVPYSFLWFLWALSLYNVIAKATLKAPLWVVLGIACLVSGFSEQLSDQPSFILRCCVYFLIGARCPQVVTELSQRASWRLAAVLLAAYVPSVGLILLLGEKFPGVWLPAGVFGSGAIIVISTLASPWSSLSVIKALGRNTLQLYVLHPMLIGILTFIEGRYLSTMVASIHGSAPMLAIYPIVFVITVSALAMMIWAFLTRVGLGALFELPWSNSPKMRVKVASAEVVDTAPIKTLNAEGSGASSVAMVGGHLGTPVGIKSPDI